MSEITKGSILQSNAENEHNEIEKAIKHFINVRDKNFAVLDRFTKDIENGKVNGSNIVYKNRDIYLNLAIQALKEKLERENPKPMTNYERIKNMSVDEMATSSLKFFSCPYNFDCSGNNKLNIYSCFDDCIECRKQWLESEVEEND